jgi:hypothetical protein
VIGVPSAHVGGIPVEETLGSFGPAVLVGLGVAWARLRARAGAVSRRRRLRAGVFLPAVAAQPLAQRHAAEQGDDQHDRNGVHER